MQIHCIMLLCYWDTLQFILSICFCSLMVSSAFISSLFYFIYFLFHYFFNKFIFFSSLFPFPYVLFVGYFVNFFPSTHSLLIWFCSQWEIVFTEALHIRTRMPFFVLYSGFPSLFIMHGNCSSFRQHLCSIGLLSIGVFLITMVQFFMDF